VEYVRSGAGPYFLEVMTYRFRGHSMADPIEYREHQEVEPWLEKDPISHLSKRLVAEGLASQTEVDALQEEVEHETEEAVRFADESPFPEPDALHEDIYA
jgi:pyruvate dehydrogenase E1 component alpha subunit